MTAALSSWAEPDCDEVVSWLLVESGLEAPADPELLGWSLGLRSVPRRGIGVELRGDDVLYDFQQPRDRQLALLARAVAQRALELHGASCTPDQINRVVRGLTG